MMWVFRNGCKKCDMIWNLARKQNIIWLKVHIESIKLLGKVVILNGLDGDLSLYEMSDTLPVSQVDDFYRYETNITAFWVVSKPVVHSSYQ